MLKVSKYYLLTLTATLTEVIRFPILWNRTMGVHGLQRCCDHLGVFLQTLKTPLSSEG